MRFDDLVDKAVVIWGAGREGRAAHAELARRGIGATIAVSDPADIPDDLRDIAVGGADATQRLRSAEVVVRSPGVPETSPEMIELRRRGIRVTGLTDLWMSDNHRRTIAITGTKGKSTTSALIHHILGEIGVTSTLVGNGGTPVTDDDASSADVAVAEVSSYQAADITVSPRVAVVTCLYPEHLPWHGGYDQYVHDKLNLVAHGAEAVVIPATTGEIADRVAERIGGGGRVVTPAAIGLRVAGDAIVWDGVGQASISDVPLRGDHNIANVLLALAAVDTFVDHDAAGRARALAAVATFVPLSHRLETVPSNDGRAWVDDSLATAPEAVVAALQTFSDQRVTVIVGGEDRGLAFAPLVDHVDSEEVTGHVEVIAVGPAGVRLVDEAADRITNFQLAASFSDALDRAVADEFGSDVVLLSPAAPSFDEFRSYEERSAAFREAALREGR